MASCREDVRMASPQRVEHFTVAERVARGKAARAEVPRSSHATWEPRIASARSRSSSSRSRRGARVPELVPIRYGRMLVSPVHVLPRCGISDGVRPRDRLAHRLAHPALRRCPPLELRCFRVARPEARLQHQRLRRDAPRAVRVGRQASRRELRRGWSRPRLRREDATQGQHGRSWARTATAIAEFAAMREPRRLVRAGVDVDEIVARLGSEVERARIGSDSRAARAKTRTKDSLKAFGKLTHLVDGEPRIVGDPAAASRRSRIVVPEIGAASRATRAHARQCSARTGARSRATAAGCSSAFATSTRRGRSSGSAASGRAPSSCCMLGRDDRRPAFPAGQGGRSRPCSSRSSARAHMRAAASGSSRGSA